MSEKTIVAGIIGATVLSVFLIVGVTLTVILGHVNPSIFLDFLSGGAIAAILGSVTLAIVTVQNGRLKRVEKQTNGTTSALVAHNIALTHQLADNNVPTTQAAQDITVTLVGDGVVPAGEPTVTG